MIFHEALNKTLANKILTLLASLSVTLPAFAGLTPMAENELAKTDGQSGIVIDSEVQLNRGQDATTKAINNDITCPVGSSSCEFAMKLAGDNNWWVMYDLSGGLHIKNLKVAASTTSDGKPAVEIGDTNCTDNSAASSCATTIDFDNFGAASWGFASNYRTTPAVNSNSLDANKPEGFWDLRIHGTMTMTGGIKLFNCAGLARTGC